MPRITASSAFSDIRVLDLTRVRAGPTCVKQFADFGADVIKIEAVGGDDLGDACDSLHRGCKRARWSSPTSCSVPAPIA